MAKLGFDQAGRKRAVRHPIKEVGAGCRLLRSAAPGKRLLASLQLVYVEGKSEGR